MKLETCLALFALALNLAFSFGHHHFDAAGSGDHGHHAVLAKGTAEAGHSGGEERDHEPAVAHPCLTCMVVTAPPVAASPPALPLQGSAATDAAATIACLEPRDSERPAFEARAPPS